MRWHGLLGWTRAAHLAPQSCPGRPATGKGHVTSARATSEPRTLPSTHSWSTLENLFFGHLSAAQTRQLHSSSRPPNTACLAQASSSWRRGRQLHGALSLALTYLAQVEAIMRMHWLWPEAETEALLGGETHQHEARGCLHKARVPGNGCPLLLTNQSSTELRHSALPPGIPTMHIRGQRTVVMLPTLEGISGKMGVPGVWREWGGRKRGVGV